MPSGQIATVEYLPEPVLIQEVIKFLGSGHPEAQSFRGIDAYMRSLQQLRHIRITPNEKELRHAIDKIVWCNWAALNLTDSGKSAFRGQCR